MTRAVRIRIVVFVLLSAIGIVYVASSYLGVVDRVLGRGYQVTVTLPKSGGLFEGSEVTYRGVKVGQVEDLQVRPDGAEAVLDLEEGTRVPADSPVVVRNLSAVGEQYLDFQPTSADGPYLEGGDTVSGSEESLPVDEADLLVALDDFVGSVDQEDLNLVIEELGLTFRDTGGPLQRMLDGGTEFIDEAAANEEATVDLLEDGLRVLRTQKQQGGNIESFSSDLRQLTTALRRSDQDLRQTLAHTPGALREVRTLLEEMEPTLPVLLGNAVTVGQVVTTHLAGLEQLLVTFPVAISTGFTGTTPDGWGHVRLELNQEVMPCRKGFMPPEQWRQGDDLTDTEFFPARCEEGPPVNMRGSKYAPAPEGTSSEGQALRPEYDPATGQPTGVVDGEGDPVRLKEPEDLSILGGDSWKWLMVGPVARR